MTFLIKMLLIACGMLFGIYSQPPAVSVAR